MKILLKSFLFVLLAVYSYAQWQNNTQLTFSSSSSYLTFNNAHAIAVNGKNICFVWTDGRDGNREIYFKQSNDGGVSWQNDIRLTNDPNWSEYPSVAIVDSIIYVAWMDDRDVNSYYDIYFKRSTNNGLSWEDDKKLTSTHKSGIPSIATAQNDVFIVWEDIRDGNWEIYFTKSSDYGLTWQTELRLTNDSAPSWRPSIAVSGYAPNENVFIVWSEERDADKEIYFKKSIDGGNNWSEDIRLTNSVGESESPCISANDSKINICWSDTRIEIGNAEIYFKSSSDEGTTWSEDKRITQEPANSGSPSIASNSSLVHIAWADYRSANQEIYYTRSTDDGINWTPDTRITNNSTESIFPSIAISDSVVNLLWQEGLNSNYSIYYNQNPIGNIITNVVCISNNVPTEFVLDQNYPNPFNPNTKIRFTIPSVITSGAKQSIMVALKVYDVLGNEMATLVNEEKAAGIYEVEYQSTFGSYQLASGVYYYQLRAGDYLETKKMILIK